MTYRRPAMLALLVAGLLGCAAPRALPPPTAETAAESRPDPAPLVLLVSIDGFRWDFVERTETPHLDRLISSGVRARRLIPSFPTKTFPNHYTLVTGLYPGNHGVVANNMWDPDLSASFSLGRRAEVANGRWYGGEPIWVAAERRGLTTSPYFWPGSEAEIGGVRPTYGDRYDGDVPDRVRVDTVLGRLALAPSQRPSFATLYFSFIDDTAHRYDPDGAPEVAAAIRAADDLVGYLVAGLERRGLRGPERASGAPGVDLILVSDHGMAPTSPDRAIPLDRWIDIETANLVDWNPVAALWPTPDETERVYEALHGAHPHLSVYRRSEIPERLHYQRHPRVPPILAIADEGWVITTSRMLESEPGSFSGGTHGYDNELVSMGALFVASGPSFHSGLVVEPFRNIHVYELICHILGITPATNDGELAAVRHLLRDTP